MSTSLNPKDMDVKGFPAPSEGFVLTHLLIVADQDRSRKFYRTVLGAEVIRERDPVVLRLSNSGRFDPWTTSLSMAGACAGSCRALGVRRSGRKHITIAGSCTSGTKKPREAQAEMRASLLL